MKILEMKNLLESTNDIIAVYSAEYCDGTYIEIEGGEKEKGDYEVTAEGVVAKDFLLDKINAFIDEKSSDAGKHLWKEFGELDARDFGDWLGIGQSPENNVHTLEASDIVISKPFEEVIEDDTWGESGETYLVIEGENIDLW